MSINLKAKAESGATESVSLTITERLPGNIQVPCAVDCEYEVRREQNYYLIMLNIRSSLALICQRCLQPFSYEYANTTSLAVCDSEEKASELMSHYECIVSKNSQVDLLELITDELHLYTPVNHPNIEDCDSDVSRFIS